MRLFERDKLWLVCIIMLGAALRTYVWFHGYTQDGTHGLFRHGDGYLQMAATFSEGSTIGFFDHWRAYQFVYPLYLAPLFAFDLNDSVYVFWLHHALAAATICLIYASSTKLCGKACGLVAAFVYAVHLQVSYWFNWTLADVAFHFQMSLLLLSAIRCWNAVSFENVTWLAASAFLATFTRPEGVVASAVFASSLLIRSLSHRFGGVRTMVGFGAVVACLVAVVLVVLVQNKPVREAVLSNVEVSSALYYGSQRTHTRADLVDKALNDMRADGDAKAAVDPEKRSRWYWMGVTGLERIRQRPFAYLQFWGERVINVLAPSFFREGVSLRYKVFDRTMSLFLIGGTLLSLWTTRRTGSVIPILVLAAYATYVLVACIQSEWDVRVQLSPQVFLIPVATFGWLWAVGGVGARRSPAAVRIGSGN